MKSEQLKQIVSTLEFLDKESLNGDPMSFSGKIVVPLDDDKILKISSTFDANGQIQIFEAAKELGIRFYTFPEVISQGVITFLSQPRLTLKTIPEVEAFNQTLNCWCPTNTKEEFIISSLVLKDYGREEFEKILDFNKKFNIGNIYWRNIGFDENNKIKCFDFHCGKARNAEGRYYV